MIEWVRKFLYRIFCVIALLVSVYLVVDFLYSGTFDYRVFVMFVLMVVVIIWGIVDWRKNYLIMQQKEQELRLYQLYIQPLEELVKEIRARQHEFDNQINAILNMHLTVDNYDELVERQSQYIMEAVKDDAYFRATTGKIVNTRERVKKELKELGFSFPDSSANFLFASHESIPAEEIFKALRERDIYVRHWNKQRISNHLRITIGTDEEMDVLIAFLKEYIQNR